MSKEISLETQTNEIQAGIQQVHQTETESLILIGEKKRKRTNNIPIKQKNQVSNVST